jgi:hypothetical protein
MIQRGEVPLTNRIAKFLPADLHTPERNGHQLTLQTWQRTRRGFLIPSSGR